MLADGLGDRHEDHAGLLQLFLEGGDDRNGIEYGIDGDPRGLHAGEHFLLAQRNAELFIDLQHFRIDIVDRLRAGRALRRGVIVDIVEIDLRIVDARPGRLFQRQPALIGLETPFEHPLRFLLLRRNETDDVLGQALGRLVHLDRRLKPVFVLVHIDQGDLIDCFLHGSHVVLQSRRIQGPAACQYDAIFVAPLM